MASNKSKRKKLIGLDMEGMEKSIFNELIEVIPLAQDANQDKMAILKLLIAYIKCRWLIIEKGQGKHQTNLLLTSNNSLQAPVPVNVSTGTISFHDESKNLNLSHVTQKRDELTEVVSCVCTSAVSRISENEDPELSQQKLKHYKDSLELGMREFLGRNPLDLDKLGFFNKADSIQISHPSYQSCTKEIKEVKTVDVQNFSSSLKDGNKMERVGVGVGKRRDLTSQPMNHANPENKRRTETQIVNCNSGFDSVANQLPGISYESNLILEAADGFLLILDKNLMVIFVSENVSEYLGCTQFQMIGLHIGNFIHPKDIPELQKYMDIKTFSMGRETNPHPDLTKRTFFMNLDYCFHKKGSRLRGPSLFQWNVRFVLRQDMVSKEMKMEGMVSLCSLIRSDSIFIFHNEDKVLRAKMTLDLRMFDVDPRAELLCGFKPEEMLDKDAYTFKNPYDIYVLQKQHQDLMAQGSAYSGYYRTYNKNYDIIWIFSFMELVKDKNNRPSYIDVACYLVSAKEAEYALLQDEEEYKRFKGEGFGKFSPFIQDGHSDNSGIYLGQRKNVQVKFQAPAKKDSSDLGFLNIGKVAAKVDNVTKNAQCLSMGMFQNNFVSSKTRTGSNLYTNKEVSMSQDSQMDIANDLWKAAWESDSSETDISNASTTFPQSHLHSTAQDKPDFTTTDFAKSRSSSLTFHQVVEDFYSLMEKEPSINLTSMHSKSVAVSGLSVSDDQPEFFNEHNMASSEKYHFSSDGKSNHIIDQISTPLKGSSVDDCCYRKQRQTNDLFYKNSEQWIDNNIGIPKLKIDEIIPVLENESVKTNMGKVSETHTNQMEGSAESSPEAAVISNPSYVTSLVHCSGIANEKLKAKVLKDFSPDSAQKKYCHCTPEKPLSALGQLLEDDNDDPPSPVKNLL
ncbi:hypoxia-inducible factor 1 alpha [Plakobranchus ocellatus]|uniref:Hypoxia-inducible factor 1 alpha n=1 Tax=Plakobranchus ocellatus TaxID=259542 RepID=A0AAV4DY30_9GAST|nr:hypoxia-inducible factor 1 alpha [Plakobranchus ocellatus]